MLHRICWQLNHAISPHGVRAAGKGAGSAAGTANSKNEQRRGLLHSRPLRNLCLQFLPVTGLPTNPPRIGNRPEMWRF
jgi:hypothetical protein